MLNSNLFSLELTVEPSNLKTIHTSIFKSIMTLPVGQKAGGGKAAPSVFSKIRLSWRDPWNGLNEANNYLLRRIWISA